MGDMASRAVSAASHCEVKKDRLAQNQDGAWKVTFTSLELPAHVIAALPGTRYIMALVEIDDNEEPVDPQTRVAASDRGRMQYEASSPGQQAVVRSALLAKEPQFHAWSNTRDDKEAAEYIRRKCLIHSRSALATDDRAFKIFLEMEKQYKFDTRYGGG